MATSFDVPGGVAATSPTDARGWVLVEVPSMIRVAPLATVETFAQAKVALFWARVGMHQTGIQSNIRVVSEEDYRQYVKIAQENYNASWAGNPRGDIKDTSRNWRDPANFPYLHSES